MSKIKLQRPGRGQYDFFAYVDDVLDPWFGGVVYVDADDDGFISYLLNPVDGLWRHGNGYRVLTRRALRQLPGYMGMGAVI